jgi:amino acid transporter
MTVGEAKHPRLAMPRAVKMTFFRIVFFYVLSVFFLGMVVPSNSKELAFATESSASAAASPFVVAIRLAKIHGLDHVINGCLIVFVFSASNSGMMRCECMPNFLWLLFTQTLWNRSLYCH